MDCHGRLNVADAIRLCETLAPFQLLFIEEPVPPEDPLALREVSARGTTRIAAGERLSSMYEVRPFLESRALGLLQVDLANCGGITGAKKKDRRAGGFPYVPLAPHNPNGPIATAAAVHLLAAIPNCYMLELVGSPDDLDLHERMARPALRPRDGSIRVPDAPGLGLEFISGCDKAMPYQPFEGWR